MSDQTKFSEELLNALVDEQLTPDDAERVYLQMARDPELARRVCELRTLRELARLAYRHVPVPIDRAHAELGLSRSYWKLTGGLAASVLIALGAFLAWQIDERSATSRESAADTSAQPVASTGATPAADMTAGAQIKMLIHLNTNDAARINETLDEVEGVLRLYRQSARRAFVEVIANGDGLDLLRIGASPYPQRVQQMLREYDNLRFVACQNTINRLKRERDITARLLPGVVVIDSGVTQIMRRQREGWAYIRA